MRLFRYLGLLVLAGLAGFWLLTRPERLDPSSMSGMTGDAARGQLVFAAAGCAACHAAPGAEGEARLVLAGGEGFASPFGTFYAPNISPSPDHGIGGWSAQDLANAMQHGTSPEGQHYYPAFPYVSYANAELGDIADLYAYLITLPVSDTPSRAHDVGFPFNIRRGLGLWKWLNVGKGWVMADPGDAQVARGRYLVEALGHCGECHTPRDALGGMQRDKWLTGGPIPGSSKGRFPDLTPNALKWSAEDIAYYLETGFTPDFDSAGGAMADVIQNTALLPPEDRAAIAAYLKALPAN
ncbi:c-type cytochrome [Ruegeria marina]|uniref:Cytochrome c, mono-and diheme variants n=1 Tax=Ruegeria marina TaxID=639004 RepID=A0A1G6J713_9RHOB|nr:cytochrome c [Ruegeria marina]SDC14353.1 Cytochrome c, mono-and diheme variants [Ruegeria marina]